MKRISLSLSAGLLLVASALLAGEYTVLGGFIGITKLNTPAGVIRHAPVKHWGTDNREVEVVVTLIAIGPDGKKLCDVANEFTRPLGDAVQPVAFQLFYKNAPRPEIPIRVQSGTYRLVSTVTWREMAPSNKIGTRKTEFPASFPLGGTPSCVKLPM